MPPPFCLGDLKIALALYRFFFFFLRPRKAIFAKWNGKWHFRDRYGAYVAVTKHTWQPSF